MKHRIMLSIAAALAAGTGASLLLADTAVKITPSIGVDQYRSTSKIGTQPDIASCWNANKADAESRQAQKAVSYGCDPKRETGFITYTKPAMPHTTGMPPIDPAKVPPPNPNATSAFRVRLTTEVVRLGNIDGKFRLSYEYSHFVDDDPIVYPGQPGKSHKHMVFGNSSLNAFSTAQSLKDNCKTTAFGGSAVCSAFWIPAVTMPDLAQPGNFIPLTPAGIDVYWATGFGYNPFATIQWPANGLMAIGGASATNTDPNGIPRGNSWTCYPEGVEQKTIPKCADTVMLNVGFPNCLAVDANGKPVLDSADHRSHLAFVGENGVCPASHPMAITEVSAHFWFKVPPGSDSSTWRLSCDRVEGPGGLCIHIDYIEAVDPAISTPAINLIRLGGSSQNNLNDGRELY